MMLSHERTRLLVKHIFENIVDRAMKMEGPDDREIAARERKLLLEVLGWTGLTFEQIRDLLDE